MSSSDNCPLSGRGRGSATSEPSRKGRSPLEPSQGRGALESTNSNQLYCKNISCGTDLRMDTVFCRICSCHLCGTFDESRDNSLWITCQPDNPQDDSCEFSCHIECAIKAGHLGASSAPFTHFDASYWCTICGKVSDILGCWKKLLNEAIDAKNLGDLCYKLSLSHKLIENASRYSPLNVSVKDAISKLELIVGPLDKLSARMKKSLIIRHPAASYVQQLCKDAIKLANTATWRPDPRGQDDGIRPACRILVTDVYESAFVMHLNECATTPMDGVIRFDIWCWRYKLETIPEAPTISIESYKKKVTISGLQPATEYAVRIVSCKIAGIFGVTEGKCFTKKASIIHRSPPGSVNESLPPQRSSCSMMLRSARTSQVPIVSVQPNPPCLPEGLPVIAEQASGLSERAVETLPLRKSRCRRLSSVGTSQVPGIAEQVSGPSETPAEIQHLRSSCGTRLRSAGTSQVPIISALPNPAGLPEGLPGIAEQVSGPSERAVEIQSLDYPPPIPITRLMDLNAAPVPDPNDHVAPPTNPGVQQVDEGASRVVQENTTIASPPANKEHVAIAGSSTGPKEKTLAECINAIIRLERGGYISEEFRKKFLTWFSLEAKEDMKEVLYLFLDILSDDLKALADQLVDTFSHMVIK